MRFMMSLVSITLISSILLSLFPHTSAACKFLMDTNEVCIFLLCFIALLWSQLTFRMPSNEHYSRNRPTLCGSMTDCKKDALFAIRRAAELCLLCEIHSKTSALRCDQGLHRAELPRGVSHRCHHVSRCDLTSESRGSPSYPHNVVTPKSVII